MSDSPAPMIAIVTPWWSEEALGGAEFLARQLVEQFQRRGRRVEVLTTCGRDAFSDWAEDFFEPGSVQQKDLAVRRFSLDPRNEDRFAQIYSWLSAHRILSPPLEMEFLSNSVNSRDLCSYIREHRDQYVFCFLPYLYGTTYFGVQAAADRAIVIPCLHNEPTAYFEAFGQMMASARGIWFLSEPESYFARTLYAIHAVKTRVVGAGMDFCGRGDGDAFRRRHAIEGPYVLFAGRRVPGKGFGLLLDCFMPFRERHDNWTLVLAGPGHAIRPDAGDPGILDLGFAAKQELWDAMAGATVFCQPSRYESFSYVLMEAWTQETPALVNAECEVLRWQCEMAGGGLWFAGRQGFKDALLYLQNRPGEARRIGRQGADYVARNLRWADAMDRADELLSACGFL